MSTARFERAACCLGGNRSILLSYVNIARQNCSGMSPLLQALSHLCPARTLLKLTAMTVYRYTLNRCL